MERLKFRAWDKIYRCMDYDLFLGLDGTLYTYAEKTYDTPNTEIEKVNDDDFVLIQFTGLHDKNGKEIYEGDILELINDSGRRILAICKFGSRRLTTENGDMIDIQCFYFEVEGRKTNPMVCNYKVVHDLEIMKVIGNIFDNPELLESEE